MSISEVDYVFASVRLILPFTILFYLFVGTIRQVPTLLSFYVVLVVVPVMVDFIVVYYFGLYTSTADGNNRVNNHFTNTVNCSKGRCSILFSILLSNFDLCEGEKADVHIDGFHELVEKDEYADPHSACG